MVAIFLLKTSWNVQMEGKHMTVFIGSFAHSTWNEALEICLDMAIGVYKGKILFIEKKEKLPSLMQEHNLQKNWIRHLGEREILIPGFVDCHNHPSQFYNCGIGYDMQLLDWLVKFTFPLENKFKDIKFAEKAYNAAVSTLVRNGTTTASYYATIHTDATLVLCDIVEKIGQRAYVGKVCMDQNNVFDYKETTEESLQETERFIKTVQERKYRLITPIVSPRFVLSCSEKLMKELAHIAQKYDLPIQRPRVWVSFQTGGRHVVCCVFSCTHEGWKYTKEKTHINENKTEIAEVKKLFPNQTYAEVYHSMGLLTNKTILGHNIYCPPQDIELIKNQQTGVCHCPNSNTNLRSGMFCAREHINAGVKLALGTDIGAGCSVSMFDAMRNTTGISNLVSDGTLEKTPVNYKEAFRLATLGGSKVLGLDEKIGNFQVGKEFDALLIDISRECNQPLETADHWTGMLSKLVYYGDDRNIKEVFVSGRSIHSKKKPVSTDNFTHDQ